MAESEIKNIDLCSYFTHLKDRPDALNLYKEKLFHFFKSKMDGERFYIGRSLEEVHQNLAISDELFDKASQNMITCLRKAGVKLKVFREVSARICALRS